MSNVVEIMNQENRNSFSVRVRSRNYNDFQGRFTGGPKRKGPRQLLIAAPYSEAQRWGYGDNDQFRVSLHKGPRGFVDARFTRLTPEEWLPSGSHKVGVLRVQRPKTKNSPTAIIPFYNGGGGLKIEGREGRWHADIFKPIGDVICTPLAFGALKVLIPEHVFLPYEQKRQQAEDAQNGGGDDEVGEAIEMTMLRDELIVGIAALLEKHSVKEEDRARLCADIAKLVLGT